MGDHRRGADDHRSAGHPGLMCHGSDRAADSRLDRRLGWDGRMKVDLRPDQSDRCRGWGDLCPRIRDRAMASLLAFAGLDWSVPQSSTLFRRQKSLRVAFAHRQGTGRITGASHLLIDI